MLKNCTSEFIERNTDFSKELHKTKSKYSQDSYNGYLKSDVVKAKEWLIGNDEHTCDTCKENQKVGAIPLKEKFPSGHLYPPAGEGCRCTLIPVID